eukprot:384056_1
MFAFLCFHCVPFVCLSTECTPFNIFETMSVGSSIKKWKISLCTVVFIISPIFVLIMFLTNVKITNQMTTLTEIKRINKNQTIFMNNNNNNDENEFKDILNKTVINKHHKNKTN